MDQLICLVLFIPFLGFIITGLLRNKMRSYCGWIASVAVLCSFILGVILFKNYTSAEAAVPVIVNLGDFITTLKFTISFSLQYDALSGIFLLIITGIGFLIHLYSISYMKEDEGVGKFFAYLNLFIFFMLILVLGGNYLILFIGWEGVGLCSYLLIGFWYKNTDYAIAAKKAFVMNRIGDLGVLIALFLLISNFSSLSYFDLYAPTTGSIVAAAQHHSGILSLIAILLFIGATGKSAQIPLFTWLPDAMAGPTPVSALIHAATMVTAGIYMLTRSHILFSAAPQIQQVILIIGTLTAFVAATIATQQNDIKKVLAYSTVSQLGFMFMALGVGAYVAAVFHVITHAFFKALLFLGSGSVIHAMGGEQDITKMGGLKKHMKITYFTFLIGCIAIAGIPPLSGFFSKDEILMSVFEHPSGKLFWIIGLITALLTAYYMFRLLLKTFFGEFRGTKHQEEHLHESPSLITIPLIILAILSILGGLLGLPEIISHTHYLAKLLEPVLQPNAHQSIALSHTTEYTLMILATAIAVLGIIVALAYHKNQKYIHNSLTELFKNKWYIDELYEAIIVKPLYAISSFSEKWIEKLGIDNAVNGIGKLVQSSSNKLRLLQSGIVGFYLFMMVAGIILLLAVQLFFT